jgi:hypothetical protein
LGKKLLGTLGDALIAAISKLKLLIKSKLAALKPYASMRKAAQAFIGPNSPVAVAQNGRIKAHARQT